MTKKFLSCKLFNGTFEFNVKFLGYDPGLSEKVKKKEQNVRNQ